MLDPYSIGSLDPDPDSQPGSESRRAKMTHKHRKKFINFIFWNAGCSLLRAEVFSCSLDISKLQYKNFFSSVWYFFLQFLVIKALDPDWIRISIRIRIHFKCWIRIRFRIRISVLPECRVCRVTRWRGAEARCWRRGPPCRRDPGRRRPATPPTPAARRAAAAQWTPAAAPAPGDRRCWTAPPSRSPVSAAGCHKRGSEIIKNKGCMNWRNLLFSDVETGTATFCLSEIGTGMHHGSGSGSNIKGNKKVKRSKMRGQLSGETMLLMTLKRSDFTHKKLLENR